LKLGKDESSEKMDENMYRSLVDNFLYLIASMPNILFVISLLSRFIHFLEKLISQMLKEY